MRLEKLLTSLAAATLLASASFAQSPAAPPAVTVPATSAVPAPVAPTSPVAGIRNKLSAGDFLSAESILEVYREKNGEDGAWLSGLGWLARGALLLGDLDKAHRYAGDVRASCVGRLTKGALLATDHDIEGALGAAIEVEAQVLERRRGRRPAAEFMRREHVAWSAGSPAFQSRLYKRLNLLTLEGTPAPELVAERRAADGGEAPATLAALRGQPVLLFLWAEWCGDCKAQAASLARVLQKHRADGLRCIAVTRHYEDGDSARAVETVRADSMWRAVYAGLGATPRVFSTASMVRYGVSATPTFAFVDRRGIVRRYTPTRLSEPELEHALKTILD